MYIHEETIATTTVVFYYRIKKLSQNNFILIYTDPSV